MKKLLSMMLAIVMMLSCCSFAVAENGLELTTENITLRYAARNEELELTQALADQFMAKYPNITVELVPTADLDDGAYTASLQNMAAETNLPDVFWVSSVTDAIANKWALRLNDFYAADPDAATISPGILEFAQIQGERYSVPAACKPTVAVVNKDYFEKYNVELPSYDWTLEDFYAVVEELAHPENYDFAVPSHGNFDEYLLTHYDYRDGAYNFGDDWVELLEKATEWRVNKVSEMWEEGEKAAVLGDENASALNTGHIAISLTAQEAGFMQLSAFLNGEAEAMSGNEFLFYPLPRTHLASNEAIIDFAVISAATKYPAEAWELAKWMTWGKEATILRIDYRNAQETRSFLDAPMIQDEDVWDYLVDKCTDENIKAFYQNMEPVRPDVFSHAPGCLWMNVIWFFGDVPGMFARGESTPADYAPTLRQSGIEQVDGWAGWEVINANKPQ